MDGSSKAFKWGAGVLVLAVVGVAAHFGMAFHTVSALNSAREAGDATAFSSYVDYPALRESFKTTMGANLDATAEATPAIIRPMVQAMNRTILNTLTDHLITPDGVAQIMAHGKVPTARQVDDSGQPLPGQPGAASAPVMLPGQHHVTFRDLSTLALTYQADDDRSLTLLIVAEGPFDWKLAGIEIPVPAAIKATAQAMAHQAQAPAARPDTASGPVIITPLGQVPSTGAAASEAK